MGGWWKRGVVSQQKRENSQLWDPQFVWCSLEAGWRVMSRTTSIYYIVIGHIISYCPSPDCISFPQGPTVTSLMFGVTVPLPYLLPKIYWIQSHGIELCFITSCEPFFPGLLKKAILTGFLSTNEFQAQHLFRGLENMTSGTMDKREKSSLMSSTADDATFHHRRLTQVLSWSFT